MKRIATLLGGLLVLLILLSAAAHATAKPITQLPSSYDPAAQSAQLFYNEARTVYLGNLERRKAGQPPLRWNRELTNAARWFGWDSVERRAAGWIGHQDTQGGYPGDRARANGYLGGAGAENAARATWLLTPETSINLWMTSDGHRANLLDPNSNEIGVGYYNRGSDGSTYVVQDFGSDTYFSPLVVENEALNTPSQMVRLYQYSPKGAGNLTMMGQATQMMISNSPCFSGANWQAYQPETNWSMLPGEGWKTVYTRIKDNLGRVSQASDMIYLGANVPPSSLNLAQLSQTSSAVTLTGLNGGSLNKAQFSLGWAADDKNFTFLWGSGTQISDPAARGGTAYQLYQANAESSIWSYTSDFIPETPMVAYFRLKTSSNNLGSEVARVQVEANGAAQTLSIKGTDFKAANQYQEFAVPFTYHRNQPKPFLIFQIWGTGGPVIYADEVTVFTASQPYTSTYTWNVPGGHYRGQGVWVRYTNDSGAFSDYQDVNDNASTITAFPSQYSQMVKQGQSSAHSLINVDVCGGNWSVGSAPAWLDYQQVAAGLEVWTNAAGMHPNNYQDNLILQSGGNKIAIPVNMMVAANIYGIYLPALDR